MIYEEKPNQRKQKFMLSKLSFLILNDEISPLGALIVCGHTNLSVHILKALKSTQTNFIGHSLFPAVCCNGSTVLFNMFLKDHINEYMKEKWDYFYPIHIASTFHNPEVLLELLYYDVDVNLRTDDENKMTPLILAAGNDTQESGFPKQSHRLSTVQLLLKNGAGINLLKYYLIMELTFMFAANTVILLSI